MSTTVTKDANGAWRIPCTIMRGGTSKGVFLRAEDLPADAARRDRVILRIFGSPDRRQVDGLGGADPLTSKVAIIGPPSREDADLDYTFGQVEVADEAIDYGGICGNISSGVAAYAVQEGFVPPVEPVTIVRIHQTNTRRIIRAEVPVADGQPVETGDFTIDGVPGRGARIGLDFADAVGSVAGRLLPTGSAMDRVAVPGLGTVELTVVDVANPMIFVDARTLGIAATHSWLDLHQHREAVEKFEAIRLKVAAMIGLTAVTTSFPLASAVGEPADYPSFATDDTVEAARMDLWARELIIGSFHKAYSGTGSVCTAVAALIPGSVVNRVARASTAQTGRVRIGHPSGVIEAEAIVETQPELRVRRAVVGRTARRIMDGLVRVPRSL